MEKGCNTQAVQQDMDRKTREWQVLIILPLCECQDFLYEQHARRARILLDTDRVSGRIQASSGSCVEGPAGRLEFVEKLTTPKRACRTLRRNERLSQKTK
jgi:hypothetical protein